MSIHDSNAKRSPVRPIFALACLLSACASNPDNVLHLDGFVLEKDETHEAMAELGRRAAFDMGCPQQDLRFTVLAIHDDAGADMPKQIGISGCNKRATYAKEYFPNGVTTGWALDAAGVQGTPPASPPADAAASAGESPAPAGVPASE